MSNTEELSYYERKNISVLTISNIKKLIKNDIKDTINAWQKNRNVDKQCFHIVGPAGVGKTQICYQIADELTKELFEGTEQEFKIIMVKSPVLTRDDFLIPFPVGLNTGDPTFKMLYSDFVPREKNSFGIFVIDEFSRGDHQLQQLLWQVQNEYSIHREHFPKGWFVISVDNPDDNEYEIDTMEDAAGLRRQLHIYTEVSVQDFLEFAIKSDFHPFVIEFIQTHPQYLYDFQSQKIGSVYANPASYEKLSDHIWKMEMSNSGINFEMLEYKAAGLLNTNMARLFIESARDRNDINPREIFENFDKIKPVLFQLLQENNNAKLGEIMRSFCTFLTTSMPDYSLKELSNIEKFISSMPPDTSALFITQLHSLDHSSKPFKYVTNINTTLINSSKKYKQWYMDIVQLSGG